MTDGKPAPRIDPEFRDICPRLSVAELDLLTDDILANGCRDAIVVWRGLIVDGYHRYGICRHLAKEERGEELPYETLELDLPDRESVCEWIVRDQLGRRNLNTWMRVALAWKLAPAAGARARARKRAEQFVSPSQEQARLHAEKSAYLAQAQGVSAAQAQGVSTVGALVPAPWDDSGRVRDELAAIAGVSPRTMASGRYILDHGDEALFARLAAGDIKIKRAERDLRQAGQAAVRKTQKRHFWPSARARRKKGSGYNAWLDHLTSGMQSGKLEMTGREKQNQLRINAGTRKRLDANDKELRGGVGE